MLRNKQRRPVVHHLDDEKRELLPEISRSLNTGAPPMNSTVEDPISEVDDDVGANGQGETVDDQSSTGQEGDSGAPLSAADDAESPLNIVTAPIAPISDETYMTDAPSSDSSTPWLDYLHSLDNNPYSPNLPFGLHFADTSPDSGQAGHDHDMSDEDGGGSLNDQFLGGDGLQTTENDTAQSSPINTYLTTQVMLTDVANAPSEIEFTDNFLGILAAASNNSVVAGSGLPFGFVGDVSPPMSATMDLVDPLPGPVQPVPQDVSNHAPPPDAVDHLPPIGPSTISTGVGCYNVGLIDFLRLWSRRDGSRNQQTLPPDIMQIQVQAGKVVNQVVYDELRGDEYDFQGMNWAAMGTTRTAARTRRQSSYRNFTNRPRTDRWTPHRLDTWLPSTESYFRFGKLRMFSDISIRHFQLRSSLACPSRSQAFYTCRQGINAFNPITNQTELILRHGLYPDENNMFTTIDADCGVLVGGTFNGKLMVKSLHTEGRKQFSEHINSEGVPTITNHVQVYTPRCLSTPVVAVACNDQTFKILDVQTQQYLVDHDYAFPINCTAISPDGRLRALVGDSEKAIIMNAETGETEVELGGHRDYGFACAWSPDGRTVATGFQDKCIKIWDSRKWTNTKREAVPVSSIWCDMAGARSLRFSPLGSGPPVLVAAEEADYVNIIETTTFSKKQSIDFFGEIGGVDFTNEGCELNVLVGDTRRGGLLQLERCGLGWKPQRPTMIERFEPF